MEQESAVRLWASIAGTELSQHTMALGVQGGMVVVAVRNGMWATQLSFFRSEFLHRLQAAGAGAVRGITFRIGLPREVEAWSPVPLPSLSPPGREERAHARTIAQQVGDELLAAQLERLYLAASARQARLRGTAAEGG